MTVLILLLVDMAAIIVRDWLLDVEKTAEDGDDISDGDELKG